LRAPTATPSAIRRTVVPASSTIETLMSSALRTLTLNFATSRWPSPLGEK
jgi:hypothetical protein